ncbi:MAG TPA: c-type cytochrome [Bacteroidia bacterium]|nr:c-type cytochrome [Bacteroidia bacterium]
MIKALPYVLGILLLLGILLTVNDMPQVTEEYTALTTQPVTPEQPLLWKTPDVATFPSGEEGELVKYGKELVQFTSAYLGPKGTVMHISNGMNCQNCHLDAGTKPWGNNYFAVYSTYPKFRERSGAIETIPKRVNDCFERSLNGTALDTTSKEMRAIVAYIKWLGTGVAQGEKPSGSGIWELPFLDRAANPQNGALVYEQKCQSCHQADGAGILNAEKTAYTFPPLWGKNSYNNGAGLFRLSRFAGYVKTNMPLGASHDAPQLTDEEAWDVAAYVNSQQRPQKDLSNDWPNISGKPVDHPFGPFADGFSAQQHKYGPFSPIKEKRESMKKNKK